MMTITTTTLETKPRFAIPSMAEINQVPANGYRAISLFAGAGGSSLGYRMAGYSMLLANEFIASAADVYQANARPYTIVDRSDVRTLTGEAILEQVGLKVGELDVLDGSPPCLSFSTAGTRSAGWGNQKNYSDGRHQRTDDLFFEFTRLLREIQPRVFVAENVSGLVKGPSIGYFKRILAEMEQCGYRVAARVLDAARLGVPQARKRVIFIGVREDLPADPVHPKPLPYQYSIAEAFESIGIDRHRLRFDQLDWREGKAWDPETGHQLSLDGYAAGREYQRTPIGKCNDRYFLLQRCHPDKPAPTLLATGLKLGCASPVHPYAARKFSLPELRVLSSFPADFELTGTFDQRTERLGRAVPPVMMKHIAASVAAILDRCAA